MAACRSLASFARKPGAIVAEDEARHVAGASAPVSPQGREGWWTRAASPAGWQGRPGGPWAVLRPACPRAHRGRGSAPSAPAAAPARSGGRASSDPPRCPARSPAAGSVFTRRVYDTRYPAPRASSEQSSRNLYKSNGSPSGSPWSRELHPPPTSEHRTVLSQEGAAGKGSPGTVGVRWAVSSPVMQPQPVPSQPSVRRHRLPIHPSVCSSVLPSSVLHLAHLSGSWGAAVPHT